MMVYACMLLHDRDYDEPCTPEHELDGLYLSIKDARKHEWSTESDGHGIERWSLNKGQCRMVGYLKKTKKES